MTEGPTLDSVFNDDEPEEAVEVEQTETVSETPETAEQADQRARDEQGRFAAKTGVDDTVPPTDKLPQEDYKAIREEREKRQSLERELAELRQQFTQQQEPPAPAPSVWEDETAWGGQLVNTAVQQATQNARLDMSEMMVRQANEDFEEVKAQFLDMAKENPSLAQQALADPHPWDKAYKMAKNHSRMQELGAVNVADLEAKIEARLREEMAAGTPANTQPAIPRSLAGDQSSRASAQAPVQSLTLQDILNG